MGLYPTVDSRTSGNELTKQTRHVRFGVNPTLTEETAAHIVVFTDESVLATGTPAEILEDERVIDASLEA